MNAAPATDPPRRDSPARVPDPARAELIAQLERRYSPQGIGRRRGRRLVHGFGWLLWIAVLSGIKRVADALVALILLAFLSPVLLLLFLVALARGGGIARTPRLGRWATPFDSYSFDFGSGSRNGLNRTFLARLPALFNLLGGDISFIGPRAVAPDASPAERLAWRRYQVRPGLLCLWWIRKRANIDYGTETEVDAEYVETQSFRGDLGIALRAIPAAFYGDGVAVAPDQIDLLGIPIDNLTMDESIALLIGRCRGAEPLQVCFVNADCVNIAARRPDYMEVLRNSGLVLGDGIGIKVAGKILNTNIRQNVNGTDLFPRLCASLAAETSPIGIFLLGGRPGVPEEVAAWARRNHPGISIAGVRNGYFTEAEEPDVLAEIANSGASILLVAFGAPKQELWIRRNLRQTGVRVAMGVGGLFDFYSGRIPRAPVWMREMGLEWLYRFIQEPRRMWKRYFVGNFIFLWRVLRYRYNAGNRAVGPESAGIINP